MIRPNQTMQLTGKTMAGLEGVLADELQVLGATDIQQGVRAVTFSGDLELLYKANLHLRTALRILAPIETFTAKNESQLYACIKRINWREHFNVGQTFAIESTVHSTIFTHSNYVALKSKDAIVDQFRDYYGRRPSIDRDEPDFLINIHCKEDTFTISLDSSGDSLHKRGYRVGEVKAPINEVLAAGMILLSEWDKKTDFVDPMCGSGTIAIEAGLMARNIPPGIFRENFTFQKWKGYNQTLWERIVGEAKENILPPGEEPFIYANEISREVTRATKYNILQAGLENDILLSCSDFREYIPPRPPGILVMNPPYGERLNPEDIEVFYKEIGDTFKQHYSGYNCWLITSNLDALKTVGLKTSRRIQLYNGKLECKFVKYEMYQGSKKGADE